VSIKRVVWRCQYFSVGPSRLLVANEYARHSTESGLEVRGTPDYSIPQPNPDHSAQKEHYTYAAVQPVVWPGQSQQNSSLPDEKQNLEVPETLRLTWFNRHPWLLAWIVAAVVGIVVGGAVGGGLGGVLISRQSSLSTWYGIFLYFLCCFVEGDADPGPCSLQTLASTSRESSGPKTNSDGLYIDYTVQPSSNVALLALECPSIDGKTYTATTGQAFVRRHWLDYSLHFG
jgi:hypothetical protein